MADINFNTRIKHKRDSLTNWSVNDPTLLDGECVVVDMDDGTIRLKIGDGVSNFTSLPYIDNDLRELIAEINSVPSYSATDNGKFLSVVDGQLTWVNMSTQQYYTGTTEPTSDIGDDGDIYFKVTNS